MRNIAMWEFSEGTNPAANCWAQRKKQNGQCHVLNLLWIALISSTSAIFQNMIFLWESRPLFWLFDKIVDRKYFCFTFATARDEMSTGGDLSEEAFCKCTQGSHWNHSLYSKYTLHRAHPHVRLLVGNNSFPFCRIVLQTEQERQCTWWSFEGHSG